MKTVAKTIVLALLVGGLLCGGNVVTRYVVAAAVAITQCGGEWC